MTSTHLYQGDCLHMLPHLATESIDLVVTSPPYNVDLGNNRYHRRPYDLYRDNREHHEYIAWLGRVFSHVYRLLIPGGRIALNIGDGKNGQVPTHADLIQSFTRHLGFLPMGTILWDKGTTSNRAAWGTYGSPLNPSFPTPFEYILLFAKQTLRKRGRKEDITLTTQEFVRNAYALWCFPGETRARSLGHPAPFPLELPRRLINQLSYRGDRVLDPFAGIATTGLACQELGRSFIGIELSADYALKGARRLGLDKPSPSIAEAA